MFPLPSVRAMVNSNGCVMPGMPAVPRNRAYSDQPNAASVPRDTRVSMVAAPCRRFVQAARWNGSPPQTTTGAASVRTGPGEGRGVPGLLDRGDQVVGRDALAEGDLRLLRRVVHRRGHAVEL